jgi:hypothetical protein
VAISSRGLNRLSAQRLDVRHALRLSPQGAALSGRRLFAMKLLAEMSATVFAAEPGSRLTDEAIAPAIPVIVTVTVIVGI